MITVIIPTRNEAGNIAQAIGRTAAALDGMEYEILIVDDASNDGTVGIVEKEAAANPSVRLIRRNPPYGFGHSIREAINLAKGDVCVVLMADLSDDPKLIPLMKREIDAGYDMVIGSRFVGGTRLKKYPAAKKVSNRAFNLAIQVGLLSGITDSSNAFKMFRTGIAREIKLEANGFEISAELTGKFIIRGAKIKEIAADWSDRESGEAKFNLGKEAGRYFGLWTKLVKEKYLGK